MWKERDKAIELKLESLNNKTLEKVSADKDAKFGAKSKDKIWYGYKQNTSVDMQSGMINKVAITSDTSHQSREQFVPIKVTAIKMPELPLRQKIFTLQQ